MWSSNSNYSYVPELVPVLATIIKYQKLGDLKQQILIFSQFRGLEVLNQGFGQVMLSLMALGENPFLSPIVSVFFQKSLVPWFVDPSLQPPIFTWRSPCVCPFLIQTAPFL